MKPDTKKIYDERPDIREKVEKRYPASKAECSHQKRKREYQSDLFAKRLYEQTTIHSGCRPDDPEV